MIVTTPGFHHLSLTVTDLDRSVAWYRELFGLEIMMKEEHEGGRAVVLANPQAGVFIGLHAHQGSPGGPFSESRTGLDHMSFAVASRTDLLAWQARLQARSITCGAIADRDWGSVLAFRDPDNIQLELTAPPAA